jgi:hypothetical protein
MPSVDDRPPEELPPEPRDVERDTAVDFDPPPLAPPALLPLLPVAFLAMSVAPLVLVAFALPS